MHTTEREMLEQALAQADIHLREGERLVALQRETIARRERKGFDVALAKELLAEMEEALRLHLKHSRRMRLSLADETPPDALRRAAETAA